MAPYFKLLQTRGGQHGAPVVSALSCRNMFLDCAVCGDGLDPVVPRSGDLGVIATGGQGVYSNCPCCGGVATVRFIKTRNPRVKGGSRCGSACLNGEVSCDCRCQGRCHGARECACETAHEHAA